MTYLVKSNVFNRRDGFNCNYIITNVINIGQALNMVHKSLVELYGDGVTYQIEKTELLDNIHII